MTLSLWQGLQSNHLIQKDIQFVTHPACCKIALRCTGPAVAGAAACVQSDPLHQLACFSPSSETTQNSPLPMVMFDSSMAMADGESSHSMAAMEHPGDGMALSCHQGEDGSAMGDECQMQTGVNALSFGTMALLGVLVALLILPLLLGNNFSASLLDNWLRDPFLRSRGTHPPSWPRRHLMLSVLRH